MATEQVLYAHQTRALADLVSPPPKKKDLGGPGMPSLTMLNVFLGAHAPAADSDFTASAVFREACEVDTDEERTACTTAGFAVDDEECRVDGSVDCFEIGGRWDAPTCGDVVQSLTIMPNSSLCDPHGYLPFVRMIESSCCGGNPGAERCGVLGAGTCASESSFPRHRS